MVDKEKAAKMKKSDIKEDLKQYMPAPAADAGQRRRRWISLAAVGVFLAFSAVCMALIGPPMLRFFDDPQAFRAWVDSHGIWGRVAFVGMVALQVVIALIPGEPLEIGAGYAFGAVEGTLLCLAGTTLGSLLVFGFVRKLGMKAVEPFFSREEIEKMPFFQNPKRLELLAFILFFIPGTPKDVMTWAIGLTPIRLSHWLLITTLARLPSIVSSAAGGDALGSRQYIFAVVVFAVTALVSGAGILVYRRISEKHQKQEE